MRKTLLLLAAAATSLSACEVTEAPANAPAEANEPATVDAAADERAIRGLVDQWIQRVKAKDAAGIAQFYAEDGAVMPPNMPIGKGRPAIQKTWADMMATPGFDLLAPAGRRSASVSALVPPSGTAGHLLAKMRARGFTLAGGLGGLTDRLIRIGHMGDATAEGVSAALAALAAAARDTM